MDWGPGMGDQNFDFKVWSEPRIGLLSSPCCDFSISDFRKFMYAHSLAGYYSYKIVASEIASHPSVGFLHIST